MRYKLVIVLLLISGSVFTSSKTSAQRAADTTFLLKEESPDGDRRVFISKDSQDYSRIFERIVIDSLVYQETLTALNGATSLSKHLALGMNTDWFSLYQYRNNSYVYLPSEPYANLYIGINDSTVVLNYYNDGCVPAILIGRRWIDSSTLELQTTSIYSEDSIIIFHFLNSARDEAVVEFPNRKKIDSRMHLLISKTSLQKYPVIVNQCDSARCVEWKFDEINFKKIVIVSRR